MSDRTDVFLYVLTEHKAMADKIITLAIEGNSYNTLDSFGHWDDYPDGLSQGHFVDINYGDLPGIDILESKGIPFTVEWCKGDEYGAGSLDVRFTAEGELIKRRLYEDDRNPCIHTLLDKCDSPDELITYIRNHAKKHESLSWDNQASNAKTYRAMQLIK